MTIVTEHEVQYVEVVVEHSVDVDDEHLVLVDVT